jgi:hypothetical protein
LWKGTTTETNLESFSPYCMTEERKPKLQELNYKLETLAIYMLRKVSTKECKSLLNSMTQRDVILQQW